MYKSKKYLLTRLKEEGTLCTTYRTLVKHEKRGIIPMPERTEGSNHRLYTEEQIEEIVRLEKEYKDKVNEKQENDTQE